MSVEHLSKSAVCQIIEMCGHGYYLEKIVGIKPSPSVSPIPGLALHKAQEYYFKQILENKKPDLIEVLFYAQEYFNQLFDKPELNYGNLLKKFCQPDNEAGKKKIQSIKHTEFIEGLCALYPIWEMISPRYVELGSLFDMPHKDKMIRIKVFADLICDYRHAITEVVEREIQQFGKKGQPIKPKIIKEQVPTGEFVNIQSIDLKISGMPKSQKCVDTDIALPIAAVAQYLHDNTLPEHSGYLNAIIKTSPKTLKVSVKINFIWTKIDDHKLEIMTNRVAKVREMIDGWEIFGVNSFIPCSPTHWKCSPEFCDHFNTCEYSVKIQENEEEN
jgi:hypothetical protein